MNKWQYENLCKGFTQKRINWALSVNLVIRERKFGRRPKGVDAYAMKRLHARLREYNALDEEIKRRFTRPGSMRRSS